MAAGAVVTGAGREVDGRDPATGSVLWSYSRDVDLCGVTYVYNDAVAVYPDVRGCGQVTTIDGQTGRRGHSRTAYADPEVTLSADGSTVLSAGDTRLELWRSDMVRMIGFGALDARIKPGVPASRCAGWCPRPRARRRCRCCRPARAEGPAADAAVPGRRRGPAQQQDRPAARRRASTPTPG